MVWWKDPRIWSELDLSPDHGFSRGDLLSLSESLGLLICERNRVRCALQDPCKHRVGKVASPDTVLPLGTCSCVPCPVLVISPSGSSMVQRVGVGFAARRTR